MTKVFITVFALFAVACGAVTKEQHESNAFDAAKYSARVAACQVKDGRIATCPEYLACKCLADLEFKVDTGACAGKFEDGSTC